MDIALEYLDGVTDKISCIPSWKSGNPILEDFFREVETGAEMWDLP